MKITALAIGSRGDVQPFVELGKEMVRRGLSFKVAAFPRFKEHVESSGLEFAPVNGDGDMMMRVLLSECNSNALKKLEETGYIEYCEDSLYQRGMICH